MRVSQVLDQMIQNAKQDPEFRRQLLDTRKQADPMATFCRTACSLGYEVYLGDLLAEGETYCSNLHKSVNGGACYPIDGWDDLYEMFFVQLEMMEETGE